jgi:ParB-like chromosome segregation protein Spo0J
MKFELHPLCALFPRMAGNEFAALVADIKANGLRQPIITHNGMILDGGNRYEACLQAGVKPTMQEYKGENLVTFVMSANFHRRHLSHGQQAAIVASATDWANAQAHGGDRKVDQGTLASLETVKDRAALSGAGTTAQKQADKLARENPEVAKQVAKGEKSLYQAVKENKPAPVEIPAPVVEPETEVPDYTELDAANDQINALQSELVVARMGDIPEDQKQQAAERIAQQDAYIRTLEASLKAVTNSRDALMEDVVQLKRQCQMQRKEIDKLKNTK